ncbi:putative RNA-binding Zn ribbon-like protein [Rhodococcus sp. AG1013]|uniref:ABATE domain-containing protein n=1 Tax=Rhodococcus sp. AG1013 TaxID=2183996 RepID=UPI000E0B9E40|nr:ABATE domain-containing protein [Rhodococcus sp. AG1013]RDI23143.1 putative RNA-binding Zn ribbon-like protein [Rhodococcus sp. AG1013]
MIRDVDEMPWIGEGRALDLANTVIVGASRGEDLDFFTDPALTARWRQQVSDDRLARMPLERLVELRAVVREALDAAHKSEPLPPHLRARINGLAADAPLVLELDEAGLLRQVGRGGPVDAELARETLQLIAAPDTFTVRRCPAPSCGMFFVPRRRNQGWCTERCGSRARSTRRHHRGGRASNVT